jgi:hypothetical protein
VQPEARAPRSGHEPASTRAEGARARSARVARYVSEERATGKSK